MAKRGLQQHVIDLLTMTNRKGGYPSSLVCTEAGLLIASVGDSFDDEQVAGFTALFDEIVRRAHRDLGLDCVDEVTVLDGAQGRMVIRPIALVGDPRMFLVVSVPKAMTWRRNTNSLRRQLAEVLRPLVETQESPPTGAQPIS